MNFAKRTSLSIWVPNELACTSSMNLDEDTQIVRDKLKE